MNKAKLYFNKNNNFITIKLADVLEEYYEKANKNSKFEHVSLTKEGVVPKTERYNRDFLVKDINKLYRVTHLNDICYNPANLKFGVICRNTYKDGIFSPIYITFKVSEKVLPNYIEYLITREDFINRALKYQQGTVFERMSVSPIDLCSIEINIPNIEEQKKISIFLSAFDLKIEHESQIIEQLKQLKKSLLYKIFPTENSNVPELRFKGFTETWEQRKLGDLVDVCSGRDYKHLLDGDIPVYGTGGYMLSVSEALSYDKDAIGIGRKGTIDKPYILNAPFWTVDTLFYVIPRENIDLNFTFDIFQKIDWKKKDESTGVPSLSKAAINEINVLIPELKEQEKIGELFSKIDSLITLHQRKYDKLVQVKKALLSKMFV